MGRRRLFSEINSLTYQISARKEIVRRRVEDLVSPGSVARSKSDELLPVVLKKHRSLIRRRLDNVDLQLQDNKARSLALAAPRVTNILVRPHETFSFWSLVGRPSARRGYTRGVTIAHGAVGSGIGGGLCQFTNLLHWMVLHTDLKITEHHHHNGLDLFPDFNRQIPFGTGTSIVYNYLDYRFYNDSEKTYQIIVSTTDEYLCGEIRSTVPLDVKVHIREEDAYFYEREGQLYRHNRVFRRVVDKRTGDTAEDRLLLENDARVVYDRSLVDPDKIRTSRATALV